MNPTIPSKFRRPTFPSPASSPSSSFSVSAHFPSQIIARKNGIKAEVLWSAVGADESFAVSKEGEVTFDPSLN